MDSLRRFCIFIADCFWPRIELPTHTDAEALRSDWEAVGNDMRIAMRQVVAEHEKSKRDG